MEYRLFLNRYRLCLGRNGRPVQLHRSPLAQTYRAQETITGREVALSLVIPKPGEPLIRRQVEQRAAAAKRIHQINLPPLYDFGYDDEALVYVSELCDGPTAAAWVAARGPLTLSAALRVALQVVNALHTTGFDGVYHPALNPENIILLAEQRTGNDWPQIGLVNWFLPVSNLAGSEAEFDGSALFASPEQLQNGQLEMASQVYSLGATILFLISGLAPSSAPGVQPLAVRLRSTPQPIRHLLDRMMRVNPEERPQDPLALAAYLQACLARVERREKIARQLALPLIATGRAANRLMPSELPSKPLAIAALLLGLASAAAFVFLGPWQERQPLAEATEVVGIQADLPNETLMPTAHAHAPAPAITPAVIANHRTNKNLSHHGATSRVTAATTPEVAPPAEGPVSNPPATIAQIDEPQPANTGSAALPESTSPPVEEFANATSPTLESAGATPSIPKASETKRKTKPLAQRSDRRTTSRRHTTKVANKSKSSRLLREAKRAQPIPELRVGSASAELVGTTSDGQWILSVSDTGERIVVPPPPGFNP